MIEKRKNEKNIYLTPFDPFAYRRPFLAKSAFPDLQIFDYLQAYKQMGVLGKILNYTYQAARRSEGVIVKTPRFNKGGYLASAYMYDLIHSLPLSKIKAETIIILDTLLMTANALLKDHSVLIDWMDVWMWPWDEMNSLDTNAIEKADGVIFWSKPFMNLITKRFRIKKFVYVPYGINLMDFNPLKFGKGNDLRKKLGLEKKFLITYSGGGGLFGGLDLQGISKTLKAFQMISSSLKNAVLVLQTPQLNVQAKKIIKDLGIENKTLIIDFLPFKSLERLNLFAATDLFLAPTSRHPFAYYAERMKFFQFMAAAKPILTEKAPGALSVFGEGAYYVDIDDTEAMASAILRLANDRNLAENLGVQSRKRLEDNFEWSKLMPTYKDFVLSITEERT